MCMWGLFVIIVLLSIHSYAQKPFEFPDHPLKAVLNQHFHECKANNTLCAARTNDIVFLAARMANDYSGLLHPDIGQSILQEAFYHIDPGSPLGSRLNHILAVLAFSQGDLAGAQKSWEYFNRSDLVSMRSLTAQIIMKGNEEKRGIEHMNEYASLLVDRFESVLDEALAPPRVSEPVDSQRFLSHRGLWSTIADAFSSFWRSTSAFFSSAPLADVVRSDHTPARPRPRTPKNIAIDREGRVPSSDHSELVLLDFLLSEAQGGIRKTSRLSDMSLSVVDFEETNSGQRFRLAVGLAKLGLFDLSLRHVWLSATPWEAPLYLFRAKLVFSPVHKDMRALALAVDHFERQGEDILSQKSPPFSAEMNRVCDSPNEAALALQSLPLLHLAGCSSPRYALTMGHSPVALSVLLSEVFLKMCPPQAAPAHLHPWGADAIAPSASAFADSNGNANENGNANFKRESGRAKTAHAHAHAPAHALASRTGSARSASGVGGEGEDLRPVLRIGIVSGSLDGVPGTIVVGMLSSLRRERFVHVRIELIAMCFPTPRDRTTDKANTLFDSHINLTPYNKTQAIQRILDTKADLILFADAALDSRVFALAHERLAVWQGCLWGWGGTLGIKTFDFYFIPEPLLIAASCPKQSLRSNPLGSDGGDIDSNVAYYENVNQPPQTLFSEQVVLLKGLPPLPPVHAAQRTELWKILQERYLLPPANQVHLYLFPGSVRHMHPEFDAVLEVLLRTDPAALVVLAVPRTGRDNLPTVHVAVRHDLMHPTMPVAATSKLRQRLRTSLGVEAASRVRVLPPLDEHIYHALRRQVIAVFDPYPVGMHVQIIESLKEGIPVVSAPALQECTHSHMPGIARALQLSFWDWPTTAEEYAVLAMRLQRERSLQMAFVPPDALRTSFIPKEERHSTLTPDTPTIVSHTDRVRGHGASASKTDADRSGVKRGGLSTGGLGADDVDPAVSSADASEGGDGGEEGDKDDKAEAFSRAAVDALSQKYTKEQNLMDLMGSLEGGTHGEQIVGFLLRLKYGQQDLTETE